MVLHDAAHMSFWPNKTLNAITGNLISLIVFSNYAKWRDGHNKHHKVHGRIDVFDESASIQYSVNQFKNKSKAFRTI